MKILFFILVGLVFVELLSWLSFRLVFSRYSRHNRLPEFPPVSDELLSKFRSWHPVLGWANVPSYTKKKDGYTSNTDLLGSRTPWEPERTAGKIACYGDSYCFGLNVNDHETWPWRLGQRSGYRVANYGSGNYGFDQAILRMYEKDAADPAEIIIMALATDASERIRSVYVHYGQVGNFLAVKPRFKVNEENNLELVPSPVKKKEDLKRLADFSRYFHQHDANYPVWQDIRGHFPYFISLFRGGWIWAPFVILGERLGAKGLQPKYKLASRDNLIITAWEEEIELFARLAGEFCQYCLSKGKKPVMLFHNQKKWVLWTRDRGCRPYEKALAEITRKYPELTVADSMDWLLALDDQQLDACYGSSHHSPAGNRFIAEKLYDELRRQGIMQKAG